MIQLGFSLQVKYDRPLEQVVQLLHNAGFSAVSPLWSSDLPLEQLSFCLQKYNMTIQSLHAPHKGIPLLWDPGNPLSAEVVTSIADCIDACAQYKIPVTVIHGWQGQNYQFPDTPLDFTNFDYIVDYAAQMQVSIAFENLEGEEYLEALMIRYCDRSHIGYCWDSGHDNCYLHKLDFLKAFGDRLIMTHINDNFGLRDPDGVPTTKDDLHFLPFDGSIHWETAIGRLKGLPKQNILNFELKKVSKSNDPEDLLYEKLSLEEYIQLAGQRARQIANLYEKIME